MFQVSEVFGLVINGGRPVLPDKKMLCPTSLRSLCEQCWDQDPARRPTFEEIIVLLNTQVLVDCAVFSSKGRKLWKTCFVAGEELREAAPFAEFLECFCRYFTDDGAVPRATEASYKCLRDIFCGRDGQGQEEVRLATYGRMLGFFGPLEKASCFRCSSLSFSRLFSRGCGCEAFWKRFASRGSGARRAARLRARSWRRSRAAPFWCGTPRRTRTLPFPTSRSTSRAKRCVSFACLLPFSNRVPAQEIFHTRVVHTYASTHYVIPTTRAGSRTCASLAEVVQALRDGTSQLMHKPCPGGPYATFFAETSVDSGYGYQGGYQAADVEADFPEDDRGPVAVSGSLKVFDLVVGLVNFFTFSRSAGELCGVSAAPGAAQQLGLARADQEDGRQENRLAAGA